MLKRIETNQLCVGMFIESLEGAWLNTSFAGRRFMLENEADARLLKSSNISGIYINTAKGLDAPAARTAIKPPRKPRLSARLKQEHVAIAKTVTEATDRLKDVFATVQAGGRITVDSVSPIVKPIALAMEGSADILVNITRLKSKDETTFLHSIAVSALMIGFGRHLKLEEDTVYLLGIGGLLHDIGKLAIPKDILSKEAKLTDSEMNLMRSHPEYGHSLLKRQSDMSEIVLDVCLHHHEHPDGKGYPFGLVGDQISLYARIATICDVYDAITSTRPYKKPWTQLEATDWMLDRKGFFDRQLLHQFISGVLRP